MAEVQEIVFDGGKYRGKLNVEGQFHGQGVAEYTSGDVYEGEFSNDLFHGRGCYKWADGDKYDGEYEEDRQHGYGTLIDATGEYTGQWVQDKRHGFGRQTFLNSGEIYEGEWFDDKRHGYGRVIQKHGSENAQSYYEGGWRDNQYHGRGMSKNPDGDLYEGEFQCGKPHGQGIYNWSNGITYLGYFVDGKKHGEGREKLPGGSWLTGRWQFGSADRSVTAERVEQLEMDSFTKEFRGTYGFQSKVVTNPYNIGANGENGGFGADMSIPGTSNPGTINVHHADEPVNKNNASANGGSSSENLSDMDSVLPPEIPASKAVELATSSIVKPTGATATTTGGANATTGAAVSSSTNNNNAPSTVNNNKQAAPTPEPVTTTTNRNDASSPSNTSNNSSNLNVTSSQHLQVSSARGNNNSMASLSMSMSQTTNVMIVTEADLEDYTVSRLLGKGSFGSVFEALLQSGKQVCVKQIELGNIKSDAELQTLENEINLMKRLHHPNIVEYYGCRRDPEKNMLSIFMEMVSGGSVNHFVKRVKKLPFSTVRSWTRQVLLGIHYLHCEGIIHRDIKGDNILVGGNGVVKLADFGCSKQLDDVCSRTRGCNTMVGTPYWMAPEVIKCEADTGYGTKSDIWSVGCTVVEMITGRPPWPESDSMWAAVFKIANSAGLPPGIPESLPDDLMEFLLRCFDRDPKTRATAEELLEMEWFKKDQ